MAKTKELTENKLTIKMQRFVDLYLTSGNATKAAIEAGYSKKTAYSIGSENLKKPEIIEYMKRRRLEIEELLGFNKLTVIKDLLSIKDKCMQVIPVMEFDRELRMMLQVMEVNSNGEEVGVFQFDSNGAIKALMEISKMMNYYSYIDPAEVPISSNNQSVVVINKTYVNQESNRSTS